jgi:succinate dehydrogenase / fumarate reductase flavoprotein subunit
MIFGKSTNSVISTGAAAGAVYEQGARYANGEFIQVHPTAIPGEDKLRLMSESIRGEGGRVWTYRDGKPWYFLEEMYPAYGNLVPRDIATRAIFRVCVEMGLGINGEHRVYLDISHVDPAVLEAKLGGVLHTYATFKGRDPKKVPMEVFPAVHYSMGGLWVDFDGMTNIPGLFAVGEVDYQYHGANRLGANSLLSCIHGGFAVGPAAVAFTGTVSRAAADVPPAVFARELARQEAIHRRLMAAHGAENPYKLHQELGEWMTNNVTVIRYNDKLDATDLHVVELLERYRDIRLPDASGWANQSLFFTRALWHMLVLARAIIQGARLRDESRGAHYKPEFPERDDARFLKTTIAEYSEKGPRFSYEDVDLRYIPPRPRRYDVVAPAVPVSPQEPAAR